MSDACGCGHDEPTTDEQAEEHEPERLWQVRANCSSPPFRGCCCWPL